MLVLNLVCDDNFILQSHNIGIAVVEVRADGALPIAVIYCDLEVVVVLPRVDHEARLVLPISNAKAPRWPKHHLGSPHEVEHDVFKLGHECLLVDDVEVYLVFTDNLNPDVSLDEVDLPARIGELVVLVPVGLLATLVELLLEEQDRARGPSYQGAVKHQVHVAQVALCHFLVRDVGRVLQAVREALTLPVEGVDLFVVFRVERLYRKVPDRGLIDRVLLNLTQHLAAFVRVGEAELLLLKAVIDLNEEVATRQEHRRDQWLEKLRKRQIQFLLRILP